ncbi:hypothetical protein V5799_003582 [Amblyomma americanum]|uniref:Uncharacterized protein n=1 Tax=Amblyomma americanum TaxID=6943 RepID=A0AAQ4D8J2_AMBAM
MAEEELSEKFARREAIERGEIKEKVSEGFNPYIEFSRKEIKEYEKHFKKNVLPRQRKFRVECRMKVNVGESTHRLHTVSISFAAR